MSVRFDAFRSQASPPQPREPQGGPPAGPQPASPGPWAETFPGLVLVLDAAGAIVYSNRGLSGLDPKELAGVDALNFVPEPQRALVGAAIRDAVHPGLSHAIDLPLLDPGGRTWAWHLAGLAPTVLPGGRKGVLVTAIDITQRRAEEERLRHSERMLVDTEGITHIGTWYWDITQPHAQWSDELYRIYGLDRATHTPTYQDYLTRVHPDDVERVKSATEAVFKDRKPYSHDERIRHTDGSWRWLHTWAHAIDDGQGNLKALVGVCQDITDRKRAEAAVQQTQARFHALFERSVVGVAMLDPQGKILEANGALRALRGAPDEDLHGRPLPTLFGVEAAQVCQTAVADLAAGRASGRQVDLPLERAGKAPLDVRLTLAVVPGGDGGAPFTVATVEDRSLAGRATEADRLAYVRLQELRQVEEASERRRQLLNVASHELKNPLTPVRMQLHMLERGLLGPLSEKQSRAVAVASKQVHRITMLLQDVLDVARIEQGQLALRPERMDAAISLQHVQEAFQDVAREWGVVLTTAAEPGLWIDGDPERLEQVIVNLVSNGLKFTPSGGRVEVTGAREGDRAVLRVADTGVGMDAQQRARLFKAFSQVHAPGAARQEGTGLGLYIARSIVEAMRGTLDVDSLPGRGTVFTVRLPAAAAPATP